ncbi:insulin-degrading enzyme [Pelomyxa schiedti]|nr:insulin-degrading enzyme [Pelomyxa schiedti]
MSGAEDKGAGCVGKSITDCGTAVSTRVPLTFDVKPRFITLENGLTACLFSDPTADKAAASMSVRIGSDQDPANIPGLAHFLEHMLFLGTEKYPDETSYKDFMQKHGGTNNAYTAGQETNYHFDITAPFLQGALDLFAQFFIAPLFTESATDREINAVDSEHARNLQDEGRRRAQLIYMCCTTGHPLARFKTGCKETLMAQGLQATREALISFYQKFYDPSLMKLSVLGRESLDELEALVRELFSGIKKRPQAPDITSPVPVFSSEKAGSVFHVVPVKEGNQVSIFWPMPPTDIFYKEKPTHYLGHLLGHESKGSLFHTLTIPIYYMKSIGWATSLVAGTWRSRTDSTVFMCDITVTEAGLEHKEDIVSLVFQYIKMLKSVGVQPWIFEELKNHSEVTFSFMSKMQPSSLTQMTASSMHLYPTHDVFCGPELMEVYNPDRISHFLNFLVPEAAIILYSSKSFSDIASETEKWNGACYNVTNLSKELIAKWNTDAVTSSLHLPARNEFLSSMASLTQKVLPEVPQKFPSLLLKNDRVTCYHWQDFIYQVPKIVACFRLYSPMMYGTPQLSTLTRMFVALCLDIMNQWIYMSEIAGHSAGFVVNSLGIQVISYGYSDKLHILLQKVFHLLASCAPLFEEQRFAMIKQRMIDRRASISTMQPTIQCSKKFHDLMCDFHWTVEEKLAALKEITFEDIKWFASRLFTSPVCVTGLIMGNISQEESMEIIKNVEMNVCPTLRPPVELCRRHVALSAGTELCYPFVHPNPADVNSAVLVYFQIGEEALLTNILTDFVCHLIYEQCYFELRQRQQLGYVVHSGLKVVRGIQGFYISVQSSKYDPNILHQRVEQFVVDFFEIMKGISDEDFNTYRDSLIAKKLQKDLSLLRLNDKHWNEVIRKRYQFDKLQKEAAELTKVTKDMVIEFYSQHIVDKTKRRKLVVQCFSAKHKAAEAPSPDSTSTPLPPGTIIADPIHFKNTMPLFPLSWCKTPNNQP